MDIAHELKVRPATYFNFCDLEIGAAIVISRSERDEAVKEIERLREELAEFTRLKEYARSLGQETYHHLHARNEQFRAALEKIAGQADNNWTKGVAQNALKDICG